MKSILSQLIIIFLYHFVCGYYSFNNNNNLNKIIQHRNCNNKKINHKFTTKLYNNNNNNNNINNINVINKKNILKHFNNIILFSTITTIIKSSDLAYAFDDNNNNNDYDNSNDNNVDITKMKTYANNNNNRTLNSDEFIIAFKNVSLGLKLAENNYKGFSVVIVKDIVNTDLKINNPELNIGDKLLLLLLLLLFIVIIIIIIYYNYYYLL